MSKLTGALALTLLVAVSGAGSAAAGGHATPPLAWGVADDAAKYADDGGAWFYGELHGAGLTQDRWTLRWDPSNPTTITELPFLERAAPVAEAAGVKITLSLFSAVASAHDPWQFCAWAGQVAATVKAWGIHDYVVWNEPNTLRYWSPQKDAKGRDVAAPAYESLLAICYDALHAADPQANVIGMGLSPRESTPASNEPLAFLRDVGSQYRRSGRTLPIMDELAIHPYPNPSAPAGGPTVGYRLADRYGIPNLDRVKQAVYDAFDGTAQPTTVTPGAPLTFVVDEVGWQTDTTAYPQYVGVENVRTVSEATQAAYLQTTAERYFACDPTVTSVQLFLLVDEPYRNGRNASGTLVSGGWQSGLLTAGGAGVSEPKLAYTELAPIFAAGRAACTGPVVTWRPAAARMPVCPGSSSPASRKPCRRRA